MFNPGVTPVAAYAAGDMIFSAGKWLQVKRCAINASSIGSNTIVAAQADGGVIKVLQYVIVADAGGTCQWESGDGTALSAAMRFVESGGAAPPYCPVGLIASKPGQSLVLFVSAAIAGHMVYVVE